VLDDLALLSEGTDVRWMRPELGAVTIDRRPADRSGRVGTSPDSRPSVGDELGEAAERSSWCAAVSRPGEARRFVRVDRSRA